MLVLIDESGDAGFKFSRGSSPYFVIMMVVFSTFDEAEKCSAAIRQLQKDCRIYPEFKFSSCRADIKDRFFQCVNNFDFSVYALVACKDTFYDPHLRKNARKFYNFLVRQLLARHEHVLHHAHIKIDESGGYKAKNDLVTQIHRAIKSGCIESIKFKSSQGDHLLQLADIVAGAVARSYSAKKDNARWHKMAFSKIKDLWEFT